MKNIKQKYKDVVNYINFLIKKTLFKHPNKINNIFANKFKSKISTFSKISNFNKYLILIISLLFFYLFYLSIPTLYDKTWVQNTIENKLINEFKINFSISSQIKYEILPSPHFTIKDVKIENDKLNNPKQLAEIKELKVFIFQKNLFDKKKLEIKKILINDANLLFQKTDFNFFKKIIRDQASEKKIDIKNSNIFFKDNTGETISIIKILKATMFYDNLKFLNKFDANGEIFNIPFNLKMNKDIFSNSNKTSTIITSNKLKLRFINELSKKNNTFFGLNTFFIVNARLITSYKFKDNIFLFESDESKLKNSSINYKGELNLDPFGLDMDVNLKSSQLKKYSRFGSIFLELLKSKLLFNENINIDISINSSETFNSKIINSVNLVFKINNGNIDFDQSTFLNDKIGLLKITNSKIFSENNSLKFISDFNIEIKNSNKLNSLLQIPKKHRKLIKNIIINVELDSVDNIFKINSFKIDDRASGQKLDNLINNFNSIENFELTNFIKMKNLFNNLIVSYDG